LAGCRGRTQHSKQAARRVQQAQVAGSLLDRRCSLTQPTCCHDGLAARLMGYAPNKAEQETAFGKKGL
jgi:hypothetical protein